VLVIDLPCFRLERCGWRASESVVLLAEARSALRIQAMTLTAARAGLMTGMSISEARAIVPDVRVELAGEPAEERADLDALAGLFERLTPDLRVWAPQCLVLDLSHLRVDEVRVMERARRLLHSLGHACRLVVADEPEGAVALARTGRAFERVPAGGLGDALHDLELTAFEPSADLLAVLTSVGVIHAGQLAVLPAASVAARFGTDGLRLHRAVRAERLDHAPTPIRGEDARLVLRRQLPDPVEQLDAVLFVLNELAGRLQSALDVTERAVVRLQVRLNLEAAPEFLLPIRLGQPRRSARDLMVVLRRRLEGVQLTGAVIDVALEVLDDVPFAGRQQDLLQRHGTREPLDDLLGRLTDALGERALFSPGLVPRHRPELAWAATPFSARAKPTPLPPLPPRPALLLREPLPVRFDAGPPPRLQVEGRWCGVVHTGPVERLTGEWWADPPVDRDYVRVDLHDGRSAWIYLDRSESVWWLQGWWD
jgi:protein ImuB